MKLGQEEDPQAPGQRYICLGDHISLYCTDTLGYLFSDRSGSGQNSVYVYSRQSKEKPENIPNPQVATFQVVTQNRYKLNKKYRKLLAQDDRDIRDDVIEEDENSEKDINSELEEAKRSAESEDQDNKSELRRLLGRPVVYGDIVQLKHIFTQKYVHVDHNKTSIRDKSKLEVNLLEYNGKTAQFRICPKYKVNSEGEKVQDGDQISFESVKIPGQYLSASSEFTLPFTGHCCEINLAVDSAEFTVHSQFQHDAESETQLLWGGAIVQLYHKDLEAYLSADGVFIEGHTEEVHLRVRQTDFLNPKTLYPSTSCTTFWQVENESSSMDGQYICWGGHVRIRHLNTRLYLAFKDGECCLTPHYNDPNTVYMFHALHKEEGPVALNSRFRIQHVMSDSWLHGTKEDYIRKTQGWDTTQRKMVASRRDMNYADAFKITLVDSLAVTDHNFLSGITVFLQEVTDYIHSIQDRDPDDMEHFTISDDALQLLCELKAFMTEKVGGNVDRRKMLRELMLIDMLLHFAQNISQTMKTLQTGNLDLSAIYEQVMKILYHYTSRKTDKNSEAVHLTQYLDFFIAQLDPKNGNVVSRLLVELVRDRPIVIDKLTEKQIDSFTNLTIESNSPRYLQLLGAVSVCTNIARPVHQSRICQKLVPDNKLGILRFYLDEGAVYVTRGSAESEDRGTKLIHFVNPGSLNYMENKEYLFEEIALIEKLCHGRNQDCINKIKACVVDWTIIFHIIQHSTLADDIKAHFVKLLTVLYIDVGENTSLLEQTMNTCRYKDLDVNINFSDWLLKQVVYSDPQLVGKLPHLKEWLAQFIKDNKQLIASKTKTNKFILSVLELLLKVTMFGYLTPSDLSTVTKHLAFILDGRNDLPDERGSKLSALARRTDTLILRYQSGHRFENSDTSQVLVDIKCKIMEYFQFLLRLCDEYYLAKLAAHFKQAVFDSRDEKAKKKNLLVQLLRPYLSERKWFRDPITEISHILDMILDETSTLLDKREFAEILMDVSHYKFENMTAKAIKLMNDMYNAKARTVEMSLQVQILLTGESLSILHDIRTFMPLLKRLLLVHIHRDQAQMVNAIMDKFRECCVCQDDKEQPNKVAQHCLVNHGLVSLLMDVLERNQIKDAPKAGDDWVATLAGNIMHLLRLLVRQNPEIQALVFESIDVIMAVRSCPAAHADMLCELFHYNADVSWKVSDRHVGQLVSLIAEHQERVPQLVNVLISLIVADEQVTLIKRNQSVVMKHILRGYPRDAYVFDGEASQRRCILLGEEGKSLLQYTVNLINLFTLCAKGNRGSIRSFCQNVFTLREILALLLREDMSPSVKRHLLSYVTWVYLHQSSQSHTSDKANVGSPLTKKMLWQVVKSFIPELQYSIEISHSEFTSMSNITLDDLDESSTPRPDSQLYPTAVIYYIVDAMLPFLRVLYRSVQFDNVNNPEEYSAFHSIMSMIKAILPWCAGLVRRKMHEDNIRSIMQILASLSDQEDDTEWETLRMSIERSFTLQHHNRISTYRKGGVVLGESPEDEARAIKRFRVFMNNAKRAILRPDTIRGQLGIGRGHLARKPYLPEEEVGRLPLTEGFQEHVQAYINTSARSVSARYYSTLPLIQHLWNSGLKARACRSEVTPAESAVDLKCLQILRTILYNEIVLLPDSWEENAGKHKKRLKAVEKLQIFLVEQNILAILINLLNRREKRITGEVIIMIYQLFFNANLTVQNAALDYFRSTREEVFFLVIEELFAAAAMMIKEKRSLQAQMRKSAPVEDLEYKKEENTQTVANKMTKLFNTVTMNGVGNAFNMVEIGKKVMRSPAPAHESEIVEAKQTVSGLNMLKDDKVINVVLWMLAAACDGQHRAMQNYLRYQPDNLRSVNLVAVTVQFLGVLCNAITKESLSLILQVFLTLLEIIQGNQENRLVALNNKIVDYMNLLLRNKETMKWAPMEHHRLRGAIAECLIALLEESRTAGNGINIAKEVASQLDLNAVLSVIEECYTIVKRRWWSSFSIIKKHNKVDILEGVDLTPKKIEEVKTIGKKFVITYSQLLDAMPGEYTIDAKSHPSAKKAMDFFRPYIASVEILKDNLVHKVYFCMSEDSDIREDIKERLKWNIDRSSSSNKLRDFLIWSRLIIRDIMYTRKVLSNPFARFCSNQWLTFNTLCILLSIVINVLMLISWRAPASGADVDAEHLNQTILDMIKDPMPEIAIIHSYDAVLLGLGISHNVLSCLLLISYFLTATPRFPSPLRLIRWIKKKCTRQQPGESDEMEEAGQDVKSDAAASFFSFKTMYYILFVVASLAGTFTRGYFFAFHLLNIVNVNELLRHVIRAVTLNGSSLIWVAILGLVLLYIYTLFGFAFFRLSFVPDELAYCRTLYECSVTIVRYGMLGDIGDYIKVNSIDNTFGTFGYMVIYQVTFFIIFTTILLNIIFGIIVDTFSELRDLKWQAEKDMQENCFICGRQGYEFEHYAKGFRHHVRYEHNQWTYILYFLYLSDTNANDYTSIDIYVSELLKQDRYDFFPIDRALSLSALEGEEGESKMDTLARDIRFLVAREKYRMSETEMDRLKQRQKEWRQLIRVRDAMVTKHLKNAEPRLRQRLERIRQDRSKEEGTLPSTSRSDQGQDDSAAPQQQAAEPSLHDNVVYL